MTEEQEKKILENIAARRAREDRLRASRDVRWTSRKEGEKKSHNAVKGTLASIGVGAKEGVKSTAANAKAFVKTDLGTGKAQGLKTAEKAVSEGADYDAFMEQMRQKYGKVQTFWPMKMSQEDRDMYASVLQKKKQGLGDKQSLAQAQAEQQAKQSSIDAERLVRSIKSKKALQAVDDKYELGKVGEFAQEAGGALGQMLPSLGVGLINPAAGLAAFGAQAAAQGYGQALDEGATHEQATRYGVGTGLLEAGIERATGGLSRFYGKGFLDKAMKIAPNDSVKNVLLNTVKGAAGEGAEEAVSAIADPFLQRATYNPTAKNTSFSDVAHQAAIGAALGGILGGGSNALGYRAQKKAAERAQVGAQGAQGERVTVDTSAQNEGFNGDLESRRTAVNGRESQGRYVTTDENGQKTIVRRTPSEEDMKSVTPEYEQSVDSGLLQFVRDVKNKVTGAKYYKISDVQSNEAEDIRELTGIDTTGFTHNIRSNTINHIEKRHGINGVADRSMADENDIARISYVINNYDTVQLSNGKNNWAKNADNTPAQTVIYKKRVNGSYYVIEAVPDSKAKALQIISAYKTKKQTPAVTDATEVPQFNVRNERQAKSASNPTITAKDFTVKYNPPKNAYEQAYDEMLRGEDSTKLKAETEDERRVKEFIQSAAVRARMQVKYVDRPLVQKAYYKDGVIYINKNRSLDEGVKVTVAHELYHALEGTKEHDMIVKLAFDGKDADVLIAEKIEKYRQNGIELDETGARAEIGAEFIEKAMTDEATINQVLLEDRTLAAKILERIKEIIAVYKAKKSMKAEEAREYAALLKARRLYEDGLEKLHNDEYGPAGVERERYQAIKRTDDGRNYVEIEEDFLAGLPKEEWASKTKEKLSERFPDGIKVGNELIKVDRSSKKELTFSKESQYLRRKEPGIYRDKLLATNNADEILQSNRNYVNEEAKHERTDNLEQFARADLLLQVGQNQYKAEILVGTKKNGEAILYDIVNMKPTSFAKKKTEQYSRNASAQPKNTTPVVNIPNSAENVNSKSKKNEKNFDERYSLDTKGEKDYQKRSKYLANSDENLQNFMKDSAVKNEDGTPKVVYSGHGNTNLFGGAWDIKKATSGGFYFTENPGIASSYAKDKLGNMETYENGSEYRFKNTKGEYKDTIDKVRLSEEQAAKFDEWLEDDMGRNFEDYVRENAPYDKMLRGLRYNGGKYNLLNVYKLMESLGYADNGWDYHTNSRGKSTFEELLDDMGIDWDSYTREASGVYPVYLDIKNPIDTSKPFPQDLLNELEYQASKERKVADANSAHWTKDYPLKEWVEDIKRGAEGWATQVPTKARKIMLDMGYDGIKDTGGNLLGDTKHTVWVALEPTQIKSASGNRGTFDASKKDIRYALGAESQGSGTSGESYEGGINGERYKELIDRYGRIEPGMEPRVNVAVPKQVNEWDKTRRFVRTAMESENISAEAKDKIADSLASDIASGKFVYEPVSNQKLQEEANANIAKVGYEQSKAEMFAKYQKNERIKAEDVATLEQLMVKANAEGKVDDVMDILGLISMIATEMGQSVQALSMVKRMSPEGRLRQMVLLRDRLNSKYKLTGEKQVELNPRYTEMMLDKNNSSGNMETIQSYIIDDMAKQLPVGMKDKFDAWRYLAMLGNPRTHIRNILGNVLNLSLSRINDQLAGVVEAAAAKKGLVKEGERTKSAGVVSKELREFAKRDWEEIGKKRTDLSNKYGERGQAERNRKIFTSKLMQPVEKGRKWNENAMDAEDTAFKKVQYIYALSHYMKANNITPEIMQIENSPIAERARQYAEDEAYRVTFQEANALASALNHFEHKNTDSKLEKGGQLAVKALMPFKKTPLNILKRGVEYSPVGLMNGIGDMVKLLRKGDVSATQVINEITQGLTGTGIVALGYFLAEAGLLTAGYDEGNKREQNYENQIGGQNYAITLPGGGTYTLDWAAPTAMPLFVGAALRDEISSREEGENVGLRDIGSALVKVTDPVLEMSCMDSLQSALESYGNEGAISNMITSAATSYVMQFVPTLSGQFARTIDETKRSTYAPSDSKYTKTGESLGRQFMNKVPGLSYRSEAAVDVWGRERKQAGGNIVGRAAFNMLSPGTYSSNKETATDKELKRLYEASGESGVLPKMGSKYISYKADGKKSKTYYLTAKEYTKYQTKHGQDNFQAVSELMRSNVYRSMSDEDKAAAVKEIYTYNAQMANKEFFQGRKVSYDAGASTTEKLKDAGGWANYFAIKEAFPDSNYDVAKKRKEKCDKYGIDYTAYAESNAKIAELRTANSERYTKASEKTEANKRAIAKYLASRKDLTNPQRQVIWQEYYSGKTSETYISVARRYGF